MSKEAVFVLEPDTGRVTVEISQAPAQAVNDLADDLGRRVDLNCAKPAENKRSLPILRPHPSTEDKSKTDSFSIWLYRLYHNSVVDGPGRRSVIQTAGCSIRCEHCFVPQTHEQGNGELVSISQLVHEIIAHRGRHDGVTVLGGEPFDQPESVAEIVSRLKRHGFHITVYSGYTIEQLIQRRMPSVDYILTHIDLLIDGPFILSLRGNAGEYRGSQNQRFIQPPYTFLNRQR